MSTPERMTAGDALLVFVIGAVAGTLYDYIHVYGGVLVYARPDFAGTCLRFVPLEFGVCAVGGGFVFQWLGAWTPAPRITPARTALDLALLFIGYVVTAVYVGKNELTFAALLPAAFVSVVTRPTRFVLTASAAAAVAGPVGEIVVSALGVFHYVHASPIPGWLPLLWTIAAGAFMDVPLYLAQRRSSPVP